jgi:hypothetical protein
MKELIETIKQVLPAVINEVNEIRIPALETAWGRSFKDEMANEDQITVEIAKNYARPLNNAFFRHISNQLPNFKEHTTNGSDYAFGKILIEDKNSFSDGNGWVGNGFQKTPIHMLKKFQVNEKGRIVKAFIAIVDLSKCKSAWSAKTVNTNRSVIQFGAADQAHINVIVGSLKINKKYIKPVMEDV